MPDAPPTKTNATVLLVAGFLVSAIGMLMYLQAVNVIAAQDGGHPEVRWWVEKGSAGLAFFGFGVTGFGIQQLLLVVGPSPLPWPVRFALWLIRRMSLRTVLAALPFVWLAAEYLLAWKLGAPRAWADPDWLAALFTMEMFAIMVSPPLGAGLWAFANRTRLFTGIPARAGCWTATLLGAAYLSLIALSASNQFGVGPVLAFTYLFLAKLVPLWQARGSPRLILRAVARGAAGGVLMWGTLTALSAGAPGTAFKLAAGFWYFSILAALELVDAFNDAGAGSPRPGPSDPPSANRP